MTDADKRKLEITKQMLELSDSLWDAEEKLSGLVKSAYYNRTESEITEFQVDMLEQSRKQLDHVLFMLRDIRVNIEDEISWT